MPVTLPGGLQVFTTQEWGARPAGPFPRTTPDRMVIHHMDWPNRPSSATTFEAQAHAFKVARDCQADHMDGNGWSDTGQHFTVTRDGVVLEGRHGTLAALLAGECVHGAHAPGANSSFGTEHEGTYITAEMPAAQWDATIKLHAAIAHLCKLDSTSVCGHRDCIATQCPGDWLYGQLQKFREAVHEAKLKLANQ